MAATARQKAASSDLEGSMTTPGVTGVPGRFITPRSDFLAPYELPSQIAFATTHGARRMRASSLFQASFPGPIRALPGRAEEQDPAGVASGSDRRVGGAVDAG